MDNEPKNNDVNIVNYPVSLNMLKDEPGAIRIIYEDEELLENICGCAGARMGGRRDVSCPEGGEEGTGEGGGDCGVGRNAGKRR